MTANNFSVQKYIDAYISSSVLTLYLPGKVMRHPYSKQQIELQHPILKKSEYFVPMVTTCIDVESNIANDDYFREKILKTLMMTYNSSNHEYLESNNFLLYDDFQKNKRFYLIVILSNLV